MIFHEKPKNFDPRFEVVGCFVQCEGEIILLHLQSHRPEGDTWGIPSGKVRDGESLSDATLREVEEETGIVIPQGDMQFFSTVHVRFADYDFVYHMFHTELDKKVDIRVSEREHKGARWVTPTDALGMPLIEDLDGCIKLYFSILKN